MPHTIVLQHTQDNKAKTRRMLWVDGGEKYNNKSTASSFRIDIDRDVVVVTIELIGNEYQYRVAINGLNYSDAYQNWKTKHSKK
ncbi:hypothetical protein RFI_21168 [Reticulomyxa filosa]|uniref:Uncharacterized protein n=1 Tax=Reticulomyxa filosa TaxID=46433 RepID=X6MRU9_RETFI|nr:hypothetical protein RFI_21168 [Reticulomyxa filosa]|eukprot:ETO16187.1 hypothetical protein RFI_21168 [Reticulomyxa filosa]